MYEDSDWPGVMVGENHTSMPKIVCTPGVLGGKPRLEGHRISVFDVVELLQIGLSVDEAAEELQLTPEEVRAASEYYRKHRREMEGWEREREELHSELLAESAAPE